MDKTDVVIKTLTFNKKQLFEFIHSEEFFQLENLPINKHRALSQIKNPRASDDDILLFVQLHDKKVVGYLGVLPDYICIEEEKEKVGWLTCFWVDDDYKSYNVSANLFRRVIRSWNQKIFITNVVPGLEIMYHKVGIFEPTKYKDGFRGYARLSLSKILPPKKPFYKKIKGLLNAIDVCVNIILDFRFQFSSMKPSGLKHEVITQPDHNLISFIEVHNQKYGNQRGATELQWIYDNPWVIQSPLPDYNSSRYYFTSFSKQFFFQMVKFTDNEGEIAGFLFLSIRDKNLNIPYYFSDGRYSKEIAVYIVNMVKSLKLNMVTTFNSELIHALKTIENPFIFTKVIRKPYLISKKYPFITQQSFQDGDGDSVFT